MVSKVLIKNLQYLKLLVRLNHQDIDYFFLGQKIKYQSIVLNIKAYKIVGIFYEKASTSIRISRSPVLFFQKIIDSSIDLFKLGKSFFRYLEMPNFRFNHFCHAQHFFCFFQGINFFFPLVNSVPYFYGLVIVFLISQIDFKSFLLKSPWIVVFSARSFRRCAKTGGRSMVKFMETLL